MPGSGSGYDPNCQNQTTGPPDDTGCQLKASNVSYDNSVSELPCAHVQCAIDTLAGELDNKVDDPHTQPATTVTYDNSLVGLLAATDVQEGIDELTVVTNAGVVEYSALTTEVVPGEGIAASVNQTDWSAHEHADGTALDIRISHIVTFGNGTAVAYRWVGPKPAKVGLGGNYTTVGADFIAIGTADHDLLINRDAVVSHPISAITDLQTELDAKVTAPLAPVHGQVIMWDAVAGAWIGASNMVGDNILINGDLRIDQRNGDAGWAADRWGVVPPLEMQQKIEVVNINPSTDYVLSWDGGGSGSFTDLAGALHGLLPSPITGNMSTGNQIPVISVPLASTNIKLEVGSVPTPFQVTDYGAELVKCMRYYQILSSGSYFTGTLEGVSSAVSFGNTLPHPVVMRANPTRNFLTGPSFVNCSVHSLGGDAYTTGIRISVTANGTYRAHTYTIGLEAEL